MPGRGWKYLQLASIGLVDTYPGVGSICNLLDLDLQIHIGVNSGCGSICNLLVLDLQMPGRGWKYLQFAGIEFADACPGVGSICNLLDMNLQIHIGVNSGCGSICNLLELDL